MVLTTTGPRRRLRTLPGQKLAFISSPCETIMSDKREYPRVSLHTEIWLGQDGIFTKTRGTLRELSEGGAFIETAEGFPVGSILSLRFMLPGVRDLISCAVSVRNVRNAGTGLGVQFLDISQDDRRLVGAFVSDGGQVSSGA